jgi:hypothetical protein
MSPSIFQKVMFFRQLRKNKNIYLLKVVQLPPNT